MRTKRFNVFYQVLLLLCIVALLATGLAGKATVQAASPAAPLDQVTANAMRPGFDSNILPANDDGSTSLVPIGFSINFVGTPYTELYVNNNGNLTFNQALNTYTPFGLSNTDRVIIAPFFADVDTTIGNVAQYGTGTVDGRLAFGATWSTVGCFRANISVLNSFQVVLIERADVGAGDFDIEFNYNQIQWETGTAPGSGGNGQCQGGNSAHVGYSNGGGSAFELPGSGVAGAFLDANQSTGLVHNSRNSLEDGRYIFEVRNGVPPRGGRIAGKVLTEDMQVLVNALVEICNANIQCVQTFTNNLGEYSISGLATGVYTVKAFPPANSNAQPGTLGPLTLPLGGELLDQDIILKLPKLPPSGTTLTPSRVENGITVVHWDHDLTLETHGCPGGTAHYSLRLNVNGQEVRGGDMTENPAGSGTYTALIEKLNPAHDHASVQIQFTCPDGSTPEIKFSAYIDPSGYVRTLEGAPIAGATVTLYRSDSAAGPFAIVPNGDAIMSPTNRQNPDTTDAAGHFAWDVIAGYYRVRATATGCTAPGDPMQSYVETAVLIIPPPVTDLDLRLDCPIVNTPPVAASQTVEMQQGTSKLIVLSGSDADGDALTYTIVMPSAAGGGLSDSALGLTYTPPPSFIGDDTFTFQANDGQDNSNVATVTIHVAAGPPINKAPVAASQIVTTQHGVPMSIILTGSDANGDALTYRIVTPPQSGTLSGTAPNVTYTPAPGFTGDASFTFQANDGKDDSNVAIVTIHVTAGTPVNKLPVAANQTVEMQQGTSKLIVLTGSDADGDALTYKISTPLQGSTGTLSGTAPNVTYTPPAGFVGDASFTFQANDGKDDSNVATVTIHVTAEPPALRSLYLPLVQR